MVVLTSTLEAPEAGFVETTLKPVEGGAEELYFRIVPPVPTVNTSPPELPDTLKRFCGVGEVTTVQVLPLKRRILPAPTANTSLSELPQTLKRKLFAPEGIAVQAFPS
jgi:hypothetical protein